MRTRIRSTSAWVSLAILTLSLSLPRAVGASPVDTYGFTAEGAALGALTARVRGPAAVHYNPAGVVDGVETTVYAGLSYHRPSLRINGDDAGVESLTQYEVGMSGPVSIFPIAEHVLGWGLAAALPTGAIYELRLPDDSELAFPMLDQRNRRLFLAGCLALRPLPWLRIGGGATLLPDVPGEVQVDLAQSGDSNRIAIDIDYDWAPLAGIELSLPWDLSFGLMWRKGQQLDLSLPVAVEVRDGLPVDFLVTAPAYATPTLFAAGLAGELASLRWMMDLSWYRFGGQGQEAPSVSVLDEEGEQQPVSSVPDPNLEDVVVPRLGLQWQSPWGPALRVGYGFHPSPIPAQPGTSNLLDGDRHVVSTGLGFRFDRRVPWGPSLLLVDLYAQLQYMEPVAWEKEEILVGNPGYPGVEAEGVVTSFGIGVRAIP